MSYQLTVLIAVFLLLALVRIPIGLAMMAAGVAYLLNSGQDLGLLVDQVGGRLFTSYALIAIPMFIFAANVMNSAGITDRVIEVANQALGWLPGGIAYSNVASSLVFSGMSGSAIADVAGPGKVITRVMISGGGYGPGYACAVTAASATLGPIIPPSIPIILYALVSNASVGALFLGGLIPGLLMALAMVLLITVQARRRGFSRAQAFDWASFLTALRTSWLPLLMPAILLTCIYFGITTATEAAAVAAFYALILSMVIYRTLGLAGLIQVLIATVRESAVICTMICGSFIISYAVTNERLPLGLANMLIEMDLSPIMLLLMINLLFLVLGCFLDVSVMLLVLVPILVPTLVLNDIDLVHFGIVIIVNIMIGLITPPYGLLLFVMSSLTGASLKSVISEIWPFILALIAVLVLITIVPDLVLLLPRLAGY